MERGRDGVVRVRGWMPEEASCGVCGRPIRWCLDMFSFTTGPEFVLAHAECVWLPEAFRERERAAAEKAL